MRRHAWTWTRTAMMAATVAGLLVAAGGAGQANPAGQAATGDPAWLRADPVDLRCTVFDFASRESRKTKIRFEPTNLAANEDARGKGVVDPQKDGNNEIRIVFRDLGVPRELGDEYATWVLWAVRPDGSFAKLGPLEGRGDEKRRIKTTTPLDEFGMVVTAEPYFAVRTPSNRVLMTLEPRGRAASEMASSSASCTVLPAGYYALGRDEVELALAQRADRDTSSLLIQARNAVAIARSVDARIYAPDAWKQANVHLVQAESEHRRKPEGDKVGELARAAIEEAEKARRQSLQAIRQELAAREQSEAERRAALEQSRQRAEQVAAEKQRLETTLDEIEKRAQEEASQRRALAEKQEELKQTLAGEREQRAMAEESQQRALETARQQRARALADERAELADERAELKRAIAQLREQADVERQRARSGGASGDEAQGDLQREIAELRRQIDSDRQARSMAVSSGGERTDDVAVERARLEAERARLHTERLLADVSARSERLVAAAGGREGTGQSSSAGEGSASLQQAREDARQAWMAAERAQFEAQRARQEAELARQQAQMEIERARMDAEMARQRADLRVERARLSAPAAPAGPGYRGFDEASRQPDRPYRSSMADPGADPAAMLDVERQLRDQIAELQSAIQNLNAERRMIEEQRQDTGLSSRRRAPARDSRATADDLRDSTGALAMARTDALRDIEQERYRIDVMLQEQQRALERERRELERQREALQKQISEMPEQQSDQEPSLDEPAAEEPRRQSRLRPADRPVVDRLARILDTRQTERGLVVRMSGASFPTGSHSLTADLRVELSRLAGVLLGHPPGRIIVEGHTDSVGDPRANQVLSERRASAVRDFLVAQGLDPELIVAVGYASDRPIASNDTQAGRSLNRRVDVVIAGLDEMQTAERTTTR